MANRYPSLTLSENTEEAIGSLSETEIKKLFNWIRLNKFAEIANVPIERLTTLQGHIQMVSELEGIFLNISSDFKQNSK